MTKSFGWDSSKAFEQDDVHQLYQVMFDALEQELVKTNKEDLISRLYEGKRKDYVTCWQCGLESANEESFHDILLGIKPFGSITAFRSVVSKITLVHQKLYYFLILIIWQTFAKGFSLIIISL